MKLSDEVLRVWLCVIANCHVNDEIALVPFRVMKQLIERGWIFQPNEPDWQGYRAAGPTDAGKAIVDLWGVECGVEIEYEESES